MSNSITETLNKINTDLAGKPLISILSTLTILILFFGILTIPQVNSQDEKLIFQKSNYVFDIKDNKQSLHYIYASSRGTKYYFYNCKSTIKESNKIYFESEVEAKSAGYTLAKACK